MQDCKYKIASGTERGAGAAAVGALGRRVCVWVCPGGAIMIAGAGGVLGARQY